MCGGVSKFSRCSYGCNCDNVESRRLETDGVKLYWERWSTEAGVRVCDAGWCCVSGPEKTCERLVHLPGVAFCTRASSAATSLGARAAFSSRARPPSSLLQHRPSTQIIASSNNLSLGWRLRSWPRRSQPSSKTIITRAASAASMMR
jgi:hypothetical protein